MAKNKTKRSVDELEMTPEFQEELLLLKAQTMIYELLEHHKIDQATLARKLEQTEAHVSALLSGKRNMTLKTLARICHLLDSHVDLHAHPLAQPAENIYVPMAGYSHGVILPHIMPYRLSTEGLISSETRTNQQSTQYAVRRLA